MAADFLVVGNVNFETTLRVDAFPLSYVPVSYAFDKVSSQVSGAGYNLARALLALGGSESNQKVRLASLVANDTAGQLIQQQLAKDGLLSPALLPVLAQSPQSVILVDDTSRRMIHTDLKDIQTQMYPSEHFSKFLGGCSIVLVGNLNFARGLLPLVRQSGVLLACDVQDLDSIDQAYNLDFLQSADILFLSHEKLPLPPIECANQILERYPARLVVIGMGEQGALLLDREIGQGLRFPAVLPRPLVSSTGAGDALFASFCYFYNLTLDAFSALQRAVVFAGYKTGALGGSEGFLEAPALEELYLKAGSPVYIIPGKDMSVPQLSLRFVRSRASAEVLASIHQGCIQRDQLDPLSLQHEVPGIQAISEALEEVEKDPSSSQRLLLQAGNQAIGFLNQDIWQEADDMWVYLNLGRLLPAWRRRGIGSFMLRLNEYRLRARAAVEHPGGKAELAANASSSEIDAAELLRAAGYQVAYNVLEMKLPADIALPLAHLPAGFELRPVTPDALLQIAYSIQESYQGEYDNDRYADRFDPQVFALELSEHKHDRSLWKVAWAGSAVAGQVLSRISGTLAEVFEVSVRPVYRKRGLARCLLLEALHTLRQRGLQEIRLHTVAEFPTRARDLYTSVGFRVLKVHPRYRKSMTA